MSTAYLNLARPFERALASASRVSVHQQQHGSSCGRLKDMQFAERHCVGAQSPPLLCSVHMHSP